MKADTLNYQLAFGCSTILNSEGAEFLSRLRASKSLGESFYLLTRSLNSFLCDEELTCFGLLKILHSARGKNRKLNSSSGARKLFWRKLKFLIHFWLQRDENL